MDGLVDLISAAQAGEEDAWERLVDRYVPLVMSVLRGFRLCAADAEDVAQVVWLRLVEHLAELREPRALPMWLITTTRNECLRVVRLNRRCQPVDLLTDQAAAGVDHTRPDERLLRDEAVEALLEAVAELPDDDRAWLPLLTADPPLPYGEIARLTGRPSGPPSRTWPAPGARSPWS